MLKIVKPKSIKDSRTILQKIPQKVIDTKVKEGKTELKQALTNLKIKLDAKPIAQSIYFSHLKQPNNIVQYTPISEDVSQGFTNFCVGCTISRHFLTIIVDILKLNGDMLNRNIGTKLFKFYMFRCIHLKNKDNGLFEKREDSDVVPYSLLVLFMNEVNYGNFQLFVDKFYGNYSISTGHATPIVDKSMSHASFSQNNDKEHPASDIFSVDELSHFIDGISENDIQEMYAILTNCSTILHSQTKKLMIHSIIFREPQYIIDYLLENGKDSIITLASAEIGTPENPDNWDTLEKPPRTLDITFKASRNRTDIEQAEHSVVGYNIFYEGSVPFIYIKNSYKDNGQIVKSRSGANMTILKYQLDLESVKFIKDCVKVSIVDDVEKAKGISKKNKRKQKKTKRKTRKQNKLK